MNHRLPVNHPLRCDECVQGDSPVARDPPSPPLWEGVRDVVADLNKRITARVRVPSGPNIPLLPVDLEPVVEQWKAQRANPEPSVESGPVERAGSPRRRPRFFTGAGTPPRAVETTYSNKLSCGTVMI